MPVSKHRKKGLTPRQWRKRRNKSRANVQEQWLAEKRGMKKAMQLMQEQYESEEGIRAKESGKEKSEQG
jgi:hypothetical protein